MEKLTWLLSYQVSYIQNTNKKVLFIIWFKQQLLRKKIFQITVIFCKQFFQVCPQNSDPKSRANYKITVIPDLSNMATSKYIFLSLIPGIQLMTPHPLYDPDGTYWNVGIATG